LVFSSPTFLYLFLPLFLAAYFAFRTTTARNAVFVVFSLVFYAWGEPRFVLILMASIVVNWLIGMAIAAGDAGRRRTALVLGLVWNLGILVVAKYAHFLVDNFNELTGLGLALPEFLLPLGVSFFTFHAISYLLDIHRGNAPAERSLLRLSLYITMFPQLVAGPIVRYRTIARQLASRRTTIWRATVGVRMFTIGMAQKVLIANQVGQLADSAFGLGPRLDAVEAWLGLAAYSLQIYYDFAGYSNMAIGLGLVTGLALPRNFDRPYTSRSITEFWRRWHISLSRWFRDYLYIPLGGNRHGPWRTYRNLAVVFVLCGLWHGASWNFVIWGAWYGAFLVAERAGLLAVLARLPGAARNAYAILVVMLAWVWFRAETLPDALAYFSALAGRAGNGSVDAEIGGLLSPNLIAAFASGSVLALMPRARPRSGLPGRATQGWRQTPLLAFRMARNTFWAALFALSLISLAGAGYNPFLYFRF
jgi:D-alanyl-lipoteichoic acid acyltransferase DltB (MBOAT superfamily)